MSDDGTFISSGQAVPDLTAHLAAYLIEARARRGVLQGIIEKKSFTEFSVMMGVEVELVEELAGAWEPEADEAEGRASRAAEQAYERVVAVWLELGGDGAEKNPGSKLGEPEEWSIERHDLVRDLGEWPVDGSWVGGGFASDWAKGAGWYNWKALMRMCLMQGLLSRHEVDEITWRRAGGTGFWRKDWTKAEGAEKIAHRRQRAIEYLEHFRARREKALAAGEVLEEPGPEQIITAAWLEGPTADRRALVERLVAMQFTGDCWAPWPHEGRITGTWWEVEMAYHSGMLTRMEWQVILLHRRDLLPHPHIKISGQSEPWVSSPAGEPRSIDEGWDTEK